MLPDHSCLAISAAGDHVFLSLSELSSLRDSPGSLSLERQAELRALHFLTTTSSNVGSERLIKSRIAAKKQTIQGGPSLHIIVPTLQCAHSCKYCQVSRSLEDVGHTMSLDDLEKSCQTIFESPSNTLTVEFQGGDPLLRFDLVKHAILRIQALNESEGRTFRFVIASTLHQLNEEMCAFFKEHAVYLSTSIDGPAILHNKNRPTPTRNSYERTFAGVTLARTLIGEDSVSALMTATKESLNYPEDIVDEYVRLGFRDVFLRPLSSYGFAKRNQSILGYSHEAFIAFYQRGLDRILHWNRNGTVLREVYASIILNKILSTFDGGYVDLQSPTGAGQSVLVYNYDGYVYPSDEARMLAETGDMSLRLGKIGQSIKELQASKVQRTLIEASLVDSMADCRECAYNLFCAPNPVDAQAQFRDQFTPAHLTEHCTRHMQLFDDMYIRVRNADQWTLDLFHQWAAPVPSRST